MIYSIEMTTRNWKELKKLLPLGNDDRFWERLSDITEITPAYLESKLLGTYWEYTHIKNKKRKIQYLKGLCNGERYTLVVLGSKESGRFEIYGEE